jgi:prevent-host-death family protein
MKHQVSLREINQHLSQFIQSVEQGEEYIITRRGQPIARLIPVTDKAQLSQQQQAAWQRTLERMNAGFDLGGEKFNRDLGCYVMGYSKRS